MTRNIVTDSATGGELLNRGLRMWFAVPFALSVVCVFALGIHVVRIMRRDTSVTGPARPSIAAMKNAINRRHAGPLKCCFIICVTGTKSSVTDNMYFRLTDTIANAEVSGLNKPAPCRSSQMLLHNLSPFSPKQKCTVHGITCRRNSIRVPLKQILPQKN